MIYYDIEAIERTESKISAYEYAKIIKPTIVLDQAFNVGNVLFGRWSNRQSLAFILALFGNRVVNPILIADIEKCKQSFSMFKDSPDTTGQTDYQYFAKWQEENPNNKYLAVDGNNRSIALERFFILQEIVLPKGTEFNILVNGVRKHFKLSSAKTFEQLPKELQDWMKNVTLKLDIVTRATRKGLSELFKSVNTQSALNSQEMRNAELTEVAHQVREKSKAWNSRIAQYMFSESRLIRLPFDELNASMLVYMTNKSSLKSINNAALDEAYEDGSKEEKQLPKWSKLIDSLYDMLFVNSKLKGNNKFRLMNLFMLYDWMNDKNYTIKDEKSFVSWFFETHTALENSQHEYLVSKGKNKVRGMQFDEMKTDDGVHLQVRLQILVEKFQEYANDTKTVVEIDRRRTFSAQERGALWVKQGYKCALTGVEIPWEEVQDATKWQADHIVEWAEGGETSIENGQLVCAEAHKKKTAAYNRARLAKSA